jgi:hypothetical protein
LAHLLAGVSRKIEIGTQRFIVLLWDLQKMQYIYLSQVIFAKLPVQIFITPHQMQDSFLKIMNRRMIKKPIL